MNMFLKFIIGYRCMPMRLGRHPERSLVRPQEGPDDLLNFWIQPVLFDESMAFPAAEVKTRRLRGSARTRQSPPRFRALAKRPPRRLRDGVTRRLGILTNHCFFPREGHSRKPRTTSVGNQTIEDSEGHLIKPPERHSRGKKQ